MNAPTRSECKLSDLSSAGFHGLSAFVAASSGGIGKAIALELRSRGADVVLSSRNEVHLQAAEAELRHIKAAGRIRSKVCDLESESSVQDGIEYIIKEFGKIDILIGNSGGFRHQALLDCRSGDWEAALTNKFRSILWLTGSVIPWMKHAGSGAIVNVGSAYSKEPHDGYQLANSVRLLTAGYLKSLSDECAPFGIRINQVLCGYVETDRLKGYFADHLPSAGVSGLDSREAALSKIPMRRFAEPSEVAKAVAFLAGSESSYITGQALVCDGGLIRGAF